MNFISFFFISKYTNTYIDLQKEFEELYSSMEEFVTTEGFRTHIKNEGCGLEKIEETLRLRRNDFRNTDCPIVIAGEHIFYSIEQQKLNLKNM